jgi:hypothetical protein
MSKTDDGAAQVKKGTDKVAAAKTGAQRRPVRPSRTPAKL